MVVGFLHCHDITEILLKVALNTIYLFEIKKQIACQIYTIVHYNYNLLKRWTSINVSLRRVVPLPPRISARGEKNISRIDNY
jgi:hypothetical protein